MRGNLSPDKPCKKIFLASSSSGISDSEINPLGTMALLHFCHCTNIFAAFSTSIDRAIKNLISVWSPYPYKMYIILGITERVKRKMKIDLKKMTVLENFMQEHSLKIDFSVLKNSS
ncbi:hypothetical protein V8G54_013898 [Vigna mungo]|uniref:Uncharacterized protein n=1 Tax=Vigna mungo TaxID=3915 RepID=A0AAQ3NJQ4_VIGMU